MKWYLLIWKRYAEFGGRSRRAEYWFAFLFNMLFQFLVVGVGMVLLPPLVAGSSRVAALFIGLASMAAFGIYSIAAFVPSIAVTVRRLHDTGRSGWNLLFALIPIVGPILLIVWLAQEGEPGTNQWGSNPRTREWGETEENPHVDIYIQAKQANVRPGDTCNTCGARLAKKEQAVGVCTSCMARA
ncbi:MAG: DUF805 domain-containing protein [Gemmataceae bacterium]|nr:DUF805 domain-containing protein [Gemmataceae bacterium]